ncbi:MAG: nitroreductase family protein [Oscillospiraceae bacterium]
MTNEVLQAIEARRSCRSYEERQILPEELSTITHGHLGAHGMGRQAVKIIIMQDKDTVAKLERMNAAVLGNPDAHPFYGTPTVLVVSPSTVPTHVPNGSLVLGTMLFHFSIGLGSCWMNTRKRH